jgi:hypothetical protein
LHQQGRKVGWCAALGVSLLLFWHLAAVATPAPCQESLLRFLTQLYLIGSYCTCAVVHQEVVTETGRMRRHIKYTLPGLSLLQGGPLPDLSQVQARFWGSIVSGPEGRYSLFIRLYGEGRETEAMVRRFNRIQPGQEFEITAGPQRRLLLRTRIPYHLTVEVRNPRLRPQQRLTVKGRACFYLVSES